MRVYKDITFFNEKWKTCYTSFDEAYEDKFVGELADDMQTLERKFTRLLAKRYYSVCEKAVHCYDPKRLLLGSRLCGRGVYEVIEAAGEYMDVMSYNNYDLEPPTERIRKIYECGKKPVMLTEFSFRAMDSGLPNSVGVGIPLKTQEERANHYEHHAKSLAAQPWVVGFHWFEYCDQPAEGRFDGENSNYGLVNINDEPWLELTQKMTIVNKELDIIHNVTNSL